MSLNDQSRPALARGVRLQADPKSGEPMLLFPEGVLYLSETAQDILLRCDGRTGIEDIISSLAKEYEAEALALRKDVLDCLQELSQRKLVVF